MQQVAHLAVPHHRHDDRHQWRLRDRTDKHIGDKGLAGFNHGLIAVERRERQFVTRRETGVDQLLAGEIAQTNVGADQRLHGHGLPVKSLEVVSCQEL